MKYSAIPLIKRPVIQKSW